MRIQVDITQTLICIDMWFHFSIYNGKYIDIDKEDYKNLNYIYLESLKCLYDTM